MSGVDDTERTRKVHKPPYTGHHPIPTISGYREEKEQRQQEAADYRTHDSSAGADSLDQASNQNAYQLDEQKGNDGQRQQGTHQKRKPESEADGGDNFGDSEQAEDTSEAQMPASDPRQRRKDMKHRSKKGDRAEREVTDPVTHLPVTIHDFTDKDMEKAPQNEPPPGSHSRNATGFSGHSKSDSRLDDEAEELDETHGAMETLFPPPSFDVARNELMSVYQTAITVGTGGVLVVMLLVISLEKILAAVIPDGSFFSSRMARGLLSVAVTLTAGGLIGAGLITGMRTWTANRVRNIFEEEVWEAERRQGKQMARSQQPESAQWLNSFLASVWPLVNPDLFTSLADTLEDVMQASLPKLVRMVSVDDMGQGSEAIRILGVKWLPTGAASRPVSEDGELKDKPKNGGKSDRSVSNEGEVQNPGEEESKQDGGNQEKNDEEGKNVAEGMEAEEGDFVNVEIAFAYRARSTGKSIKTKAKNAHLFIAFYLPTGIRFPVWAELRGLIGTLRLRLQLTPDPPFFSLCTLTFLGQPKVDISCVPLMKRGLNVMDLPILSNFIQSSVDAAAAEYVAPKSLTLDLKEMLMGSDFKKDTTARGVLMVRVKRAFDFKEGDSSIPLIKDGSADSYVTVGWAKFGKPLWATRVLLSEMEPHWDESCFILVTPDELNIDERLRLQLWDSDRTTADDDLGRIEVDLKKLMKDPQTNGRMCERTDGFKAIKDGESMPGKLKWEVGYFSKTRILDSQLVKQSEDPSIRSIDQLRKQVHEESQRKLREAKRDEVEEIKQQEEQDFKERQDTLLINSPPPLQYPSGILSIQIHQITGLELESIKGNSKREKDDSDEEEEGDDLPSSYCTVMLNQQKIYKTRTKPKSSKPFFNAGTERFIRDWRSAEVMLSVRDSRVHEDDPLLGVVYLPLHKLFKDRSQVNDFFPLSGGVGYGRVRISMVFRSVKLQAPENLLGWDYGTVDIDPEIHAQDLPEDLRKLRIKARTDLARGKYKASDGKWTSKRGDHIHLAVRNRYASNMIVEFRSSSALLDKTPAFAVLWLKDIPDNEDQTMTLPVWKGDLKRAEKNCLESYGEKVGSIQLTLRFWRGLSGYHAHLASKDKNLQDVMQCLDTVNDNADDPTGSFGQDNANDSSSSSDSESEGDSPVGVLKRLSGSNGNLEEDGKRGMMDQVREYKKHKGQLHRRHRGLMQWQGPRTAQWMKHKFEDGGDKITSLFKHHTREPTSVEREV